MSRLGCRHSSVDSSAPTILPPRVRVPSTLQSNFVLYLCWEKDKNKQKEAEFCPSFFKKNFMRRWIDMKITISPTRVFPGLDRGLQKVNKPLDKVIVICIKSFFWEMASVENCNGALAYDENRPFTDKR